MTFSTASTMPTEKLSGKSKRSETLKNLGLDMSDDEEEPKTLSTTDDSDDEIEEIWDSLMKDHQLDGDRLEREHGFNEHVDVYPEIPVPPAPQPVLPADRPAHAGKMNRIRMAPAKPITFKRSPLKKKVTRKPRRVNKILPPTYAYDPREMAVAIPRISQRRAPEVTLKRSASKAIAEMTLKRAKIN